MTNQCKWHVLVYNTSRGLSLLDALKKLDVEAYMPIRVIERKRKDRPSSVRCETPLFPGYLLVRFDPYAVGTHTSKILSLNGALRFISFGKEPSTIDDLVVEKLKGLAHLRPTKSLTCVDYNNLPSELSKALHLIIEMPSEASRRAAFFALLQQNEVLMRLVEQERIQIYSNLNPD